MAKVASKSPRDFRGMQLEDGRSDDDEVEPTIEGDVDTVAALKGIFSNKIAGLLLCVPAALGLHFFGPQAPPLYHFVLNFGAIIPLSWLISEATEHLEKLVGPTWGVLLNSTFGNVVEIILSVQAIRAGLVKIVQSSLLGAMLMNLLFVTGCCFLVSGMRARTVEYNTAAPLYNLGLMGVSTMALIVPTELARTDEWSSSQERMMLSLAVSVLLGLMYVQWLIFNLSTHNFLFAKQPKVRKVMDGAGHRHSLRIHQDGHVEEEHEETDESEDEGARLPMLPATLLLAVSTVLVSFHCDYLVESIEPVTKQLHIKEAFVATVLLPMVGNFSEEIAAVSIASKGKIDLAMGVAIGSATQIALLVVPIAVWLAWFLGSSFDLDFEVLQVKLLLASVLVAALCLQDGQGNWLKGTMLMTTYVIVAAAFWHIHDREFHSEGKAFDAGQQLLPTIQQLQARVDALSALVNATVVGK